MAAVSVEDRIERIDELEASARVIPTDGVRGAVLLPRALFAWARGDLETAARQEHG
jgi:hypothetical protein